MKNNIIKILTRFSKLPFYMMLRFPRLHKNQRRFLLRKEILTEEQWNELSESDKYKFWGTLDTDALNNIPTEDDMVSFLVPDIHKISGGLDDEKLDFLEFSLNGKHHRIDFHYTKSCNAYWAACKYKLKQ